MASDPLSSARPWRASRDRRRRPRRPARRPAPGSRRGGRASCARRRSVDREHEDEDVEGQEHVAQVRGAAAVVEEAEQQPGGRGVDDEDGDEGEEARQGQRPTTYRLWAYTTARAARSRTRAGAAPGRVEVPVPRPAVPLGLRRIEVDSGLARRARKRRGYGLGHRAPSLATPAARFYSRGNGARGGCREDGGGRPGGPLALAVIRSAPPM